MIRILNSEKVRGQGSSALMSREECAQPSRSKVIASATSTRIHSVTGQLDLIMFDNRPESNFVVAESNAIWNPQLQHK